MSRKQPSELDRLFSIASSQTTREQSSINPNLDSTEVTNCISFKGDQLFHSQPPLSAPPGLTTIIPHSLQHASTRDKVSSKFALPPPGFPQHNASAMDYTQSASILELSDHMKSLSKKEETFKEPCMTSCLDPHRNGKIAMHPQAFPEHHNLQKYPTISLPHAMSDRPYWLMTDREVRHIWRISMTPVISTLCKSSCDVNSHRDNFLPENLTNLFLNEAGGIEYPDNYTGDDFYFARYISRKGPTTGKDRTAPVGNLLLIPTVPQTRPGRKVSKVPPISNEVHLKSILPHVPKLANRSEKIVDGALGKISLNSLRHPKRSISIDSKSAAPISKLVENGAFSKMASLAIAEKTYQDLNGECGEQSFLSLISDSHTLLSLVQTPKGKRTIPLIISAISSSESLSSSACLLSIFQTILCNLCLFLSSTSGSPLHHVDYIKDNDAATVESILTPFVSFLSQLSIAEIFELSEKITTQPGLPQLISISKVSFFPLTLFLDSIHGIMHHFLSSGAFAPNR